MVRVYFRFRRNCSLSVAFCDAETYSMVLILCPCYTTVGRCVIDNMVNCGLIFGGCGAQNEDLRRFV